MYGFVISYAMISFSLIIKAIKNIFKGQIFDENISEEKFEITPIEKAKINKKIKIFI